MVFLFSLTLFVSATLLFFVQPMIGKMLLPKLGGAPALWNICMVFFQAMLLLGYSYAHLSIKWLGINKQPALQILILLIPLLVLPISFEHNVNLQETSNPTGWLLWQLFINVGLPFFAVSTSAPLLQKWFSFADHPDAHDPYFLYATSNLGCLIALLAYPFVIEPALDINQQSRYWTFGYFILVLLSTICAFAVNNTVQKKAVSSDQIYALTIDNQDCINLNDRFSWVFAALIPSSLMLSVTTSLTTNLAAVPLLWLVPLAIYLLTFTLVFAKNPPLPHSMMIGMLPYVVLSVIPFIFTDFTSEISFFGLFAQLGVFFISAMVCHGSLAQNRPHTKYLTEFYLWISVGGVLGGIFNALIAPLLFTNFLEYPIMLAAACAVRDKKNRQSVFTPADFLLPTMILIVGLAAVWLLHLFDLKNEQLLMVSVYAIPAMICFSFKKTPLRFSLGVGALMLVYIALLNSQLNSVLITKRNFFGVKRVLKSENGKRHFLFHGGTMHGSQNTDPLESNKPLSYYHHSGPIGDVFAEKGNTERDLKTGIIGLGAGAMASYAKQGHTFIFYEIDPLIVRIAQSPEYFTYLRDCNGDCKIILGDGRINLNKSQDKSFDLIILDAFSSDAIPIHLITREALQVYLDKLKDNGLLAFHISNRHLNLIHLLGNLAANAGLVSYVRSDHNLSEHDHEQGKLSSLYVIMARTNHAIGKLSTNKLWQRVNRSDRPKIWTDRYSNILSVIY